MLFLSAQENNGTAQGIVSELIYNQHDALNLGKLSHVQQKEAYIHGRRVSTCLSLSTRSLFSSADVAKLAWRSSASSFLLSTSFAS